MPPHPGQQRQPLAHISPGGSTRDVLAFPFSVWGCRRVSIWRGMLGRFPRLPWKGAYRHVHQRGSQRRLIRLHLVLPVAGVGAGGAARRPARGRLVGPLAGPALWSLGLALAAMAVAFLPLAAPGPGP